MCGIFGISGPNKTDAVKNMAAALRHRGPDDEGFFFSEEMALGQ